MRQSVGKVNVRAESRDLYRRPLEVVDFASIDGVVINPPRQGAAAQVETLARSPVPTVVMVSCERASFARDAHTLEEGGYDLETILPVDQFPWSAHLELVALFKKQIY